MSSRKSETTPMQIFWGVEAVYYGIVQVENSRLYYNHACPQNHMDSQNKQGALGLSEC